MQVAVHWQDADSSSANAIKKIMHEVKVMKCLEHVGRAHHHQLESIQGKKTFISAYQNKHNEKIQDVLTVKCVCVGRNHIYTGTSKRIHVAVLGMLSGERHT